MSSVIDLTSDVEDHVRSKPLFQQPNTRQFPGQQQSLAATHNEIQQRCHTSAAEANTLHSAPRFSSDFHPSFSRLWLADACQVMSSTVAGLARPTLLPSLDTAAMQTLTTLEAQEVVSMLTLLLWLVLTLREQNLPGRHQAVLLVIQQAYQASLAVSNNAHAARLQKINTSPQRISDQIHAIMPHHSSCFWKWANSGWQEKCPLCKGSHLPQSDADKKTLTEWHQIVETALQKHMSLLHNRFESMAFPPQPQQQQQQWQQLPALHAPSGRHASATSTWNSQQLQKLIPPGSLTQPGASADASSSLQITFAPRSVNDVYERPAFVVAPGASVVVPSSEGQAFLTEMMQLMRSNPDVCIDPIYFRLCTDDQQSVLLQYNVLHNSELPTNQDWLAAQWGSLRHLRTSSRELLRQAGCKRATPAMSKQMLLRQLELQVPSAVQICEEHAAEDGAATDNHAEPGQAQSPQRICSPKPLPSQPDQVIKRCNPHPSLPLLPQGSPDVLTPARTLRCDQTYSAAASEVAQAAATAAAAAIVAAKVAPSATPTESNFQQAGSSIQDAFQSAEHIASPTVSEHQVQHNSTDTATDMYPALIAAASSAMAAKSPSHATPTDMHPSVPEASHPRDSMSTGSAPSGLQPSSNTAQKGSTLSSVTRAAPLPENVHLSGSSSQAHALKDSSVGAMGRGSAEQDSLASGNSIRPPQQQDVPPSASPSTGLVKRKSRPGRMSRGVLPPSRLSRVTLNPKRSPQSPSPPGKGEQTAQPAVASKAAQGEEQQQSQAEGTKPEQGQQEGQGQGQQQQQQQQGQSHEHKVVQQLKSDQQQKVDQKQGVNQQHNADQEPKIDQQNKIDQQQKVDQWQKVDQQQVCQQAGDQQQQGLQHGTHQAPRPEDPEHAQGQQSTQNCQQGPTGLGPRQALSQEQQQGQQPGNNDELEAKLQLEPPLKKEAQDADQTGTQYAACSAHNIISMLLPKQWVQRLWALDMFLLALGLARQGITLKGSYVLVREESTPGIATDSPLPIEHLRQIRSCEPDEQCNPVLVTELGEVIRIEDLSSSTCCAPEHIRLEQVAILTGVRQRLLHHEVAAANAAERIQLCMRFVALHQQMQELLGSHRQDVGLDQLKVLLIEKMCSRPSEVAYAVVDLDWETQEKETLTACLPNMGSAATLALSYASANQASLKAAGIKWLNLVTPQQPPPLSTQCEDHPPPELPFSDVKTAGAGQNSAAELQPTASTEPCQHLSDLSHSVQEAESPDAKLPKLAQDTAPPQAGMSDLQPTADDEIERLKPKARLQHVFDECFGPSSDSDTVPCTSAPPDALPEDDDEPTAESPKLGQLGAPEAQQAASSPASSVQAGQNSNLAAAGAAAPAAAAAPIAEDEDILRGPDVMTAQTPAEARLPWSPAAGADSLAASTPKASEGAVASSLSKPVSGNAQPQAAALGKEPASPAVSPTSPSAPKASTSKPAQPDTLPSQALTAETEASSEPALPAPALSAKVAAAQASPAKLASAEALPAKASSAKLASTDAPQRAQTSPGQVKPAQVASAKGAAPGKGTSRLRSPTYFGGTNLRRTKVRAPKVKRGFKDAGRWAARSSGKHDHRRNVICQVCRREKDRQHRTKQQQGSAAPEPGAAGGQDQQCAAMSPVQSLLKRPAGTSDPAAQPAILKRLRRLPPSPSKSQQQGQHLPELDVLEDDVAAVDPLAAQRAASLSASLSPMAPKFAKKAQKRAAPSQIVAQLSPAEVAWGTKKARGPALLRHVTSDSADVSRAAAKPASDLSKVTSEVIDLSEDPAPLRSADNRSVTDAADSSGACAEPSSGLKRVIPNESDASTAPAQLASSAEAPAETKQKRKRRTQSPAALEQLLGSAAAAAITPLPGPDAPVRGVPDQRPLLETTSPLAAQQQEQPSSSRKSILYRASRAQRCVRTAPGKPKAGTAAGTAQSGASGQPADATPASPGRHIAHTDSGKRQVGGLAGVPLPVPQNKASAQLPEMGPPRQGVKLKVKFDGRYVAGNPASDPPAAAPPSSGTASVKRKIGGLADVPLPVMKTWCADKGTAAAQQAAAAQPRSPSHSGKGRVGGLAAVNLPVLQPKYAETHAQVGQNKHEPSRAQTKGPQARDQGQVNASVRGPDHTSSAPGPQPQVLPPLVASSAQEQASPATLLSSPARLSLTSRSAEHAGTSSPFQGPAAAATPSCPFQHDAAALPTSPKHPAVLSRPAADGRMASPSQTASSAAGTSLPGQTSPAAVLRSPFASAAPPSPLDFGLPMGSRLRSPRSPLHPQEEFHSGSRLASPRSHPSLGLVSPMSVSSSQRYSAPPRSRAEARTARPASSRDVTPTRHSLSPHSGRHSASAGRHHSPTMHRQQPAEAAEAGEIAMGLARQSMHALEQDAAEPRGRTVSLSYKWGGASSVGGMLDLIVWSWNTRRGGTRWHDSGLRAEETILQPRMFLGRLVPEDQLGHSVWLKTLKERWDGKLLVFTLPQHLAEGKSLAAVQAQLGLTRLVSMLRVERQALCTSDGSARLWLTAPRATTQNIIDMLPQEAQNGLHDNIPAISNERDARAKHSFIFGIVSLAP